MEEDDEEEEEEEEEAIVLGCVNYWVVNWFMWFIGRLINLRFVNLLSPFCEKLMVVSPNNITISLHIFHRFVKFFSNFFCGL